MLVQDAATTLRTVKLERDVVAVEWAVVAGVENPKLVGLDEAVKCFRVEHGEVWRNTQGDLLLNRRLLASQHRAIKRDWIPDELKARRCPPRSSTAIVKWVQTRAAPM
jgi:hypothetical protein